MPGHDSIVTSNYFAADVVSVARDMIGRTLHVVTGDAVCSALVVETEAYGGTDDPASHAAFRAGGRAAIMLDHPGRVYVYAAYGVYPCFNIVTGQQGIASAVLIRGVVLAGCDMPILGPGRVSRALGVTLQDHGRSCCGGRFAVSIVKQDLEILATTRVGITRGVERPWRFIARDFHPRRRR